MVRFHLWTNEQQSFGIRKGGQVDIHRGLRVLWIFETI